RMQPAADLSQAVQIARVLSAPDTPLAPLMRALAAQTTLAASAPKSIVEQATDKAASTLQQSRDQIARLLAGGSAPAPPPAARPESIVDDRSQGLRQFVMPAPGGGPAPLDGSIALINDVYTLLNAADTATRAGNAPPPSDVPAKLKAETPRLPQ